MVSACVLSQDQSLVIISGERKKIIKSNELANFIGKRSQRGIIIGRNWKKIDYLFPFLD